MIVFPNAKINLGLHVTARRPDGYHEIETVMVPIPSFDILEITTSADSRDSLVCTGLGVDCPMEKNLVYKAVTAMREQFEFPAVSLTLDKQTPDGAGLGGGSADAAFTLTALNEMYGLGADKETLASIASRLGADCPFFIYNRPMLCTGIGTDMSPIALSLPDNLSIAVVKPEVSVPTREAYAGLTPKTPQASLVDLLSQPLEQWQGRVVNDFEESVFTRYPQLEAIKQHIHDMGAVYTSMSGSGSAIFGLFTRELSAQDIKQLGSLGCYLYRSLANFLL